MNTANYTKNMEKTLADFKQEVAKKRGFKNWGCILLVPNGKVLNESIEELIELYAAYKAKEAKQKAIEDGFELIKVNYNNGWNAALDCAAEKVGPVARKIILNLKK